MGLGSSSITTKANLGLDDGKTEAKVLIFFFEYSPPAGWSAVPVFPPISNPATFANPAVPSSVDTIFLNIGLIRFETSLFINLILSYSSFFFINVGFISYPPLVMME